MKVCGLCGTKLNTESEDYAYCPHCEDDMQIVILEEVSTENIDSHASGISHFEFLDIKKQRDYIMASNGTDSEKLEKLNEYIGKLEVKEND